MSCKRTDFSFSSTQAILTLQHEKAAAGVEAAQWKASAQAAQRSCDSAEARRTEVQGQLLARTNEVAGLQQASVQHCLVEIA